MTPPALARSSANLVVFALAAALALGTAGALAAVSADAGATLSSSILVGLATLMVGGWASARQARA